MGVLAAEKRMLEDRLNVVSAQLQEGQSNWSAAQRELAQLQVCGWPLPLNDLGLGLTGVLPSGLQCVLCA